MIEFEPRAVVLPSGNVTYLDAGAGSSEIVVLLHGGGLDCARLSWRLLIPELAKTCRVPAPDWPGYGGTDAFGRPYTISDLGQWLMAFLDHLGVGQASFVGISMGGGAALWSAINRPERVKALVPVGSFGIAERAPYHRLSYLLTKLPLNAVSYALLRRYPALLRRSVEALFSDPKRVTPDLVAEVADVLKTAGSGAAFTHFQRGEMTVTRLRSVFAEDLGMISHPILFIHGNKDALVPIEEVEATLSGLQNAHLEAMDAGHWPMREQPLAFNELVVSFLGRAARESRPSG
ncbi:MAG: alpha/beta fold hydrolase [Pseudomonadota bacterium]